jgi:hypothetical protein
MSESLLSPLVVVVEPEYEYFIVSLQCTGYFGDDVVVVSFY